MSADDYALPFDVALSCEEVPRQFKAQELTAETLSQGVVLVTPNLAHELGSSSTAIAWLAGLSRFP